MTTKTQAKKAEVVVMPPKPAKKSTALARVEPEIHGSSNVMEIVARLAIDPRVDADKLDKLLALQERVLDRQAKADFDAALARMQPKLPVIGRKGLIEIKKKDSHGERTGAVQQATKFALWEDIQEAIGPVLHKHGFSLRFRNSMLPAPDNRVVITTILAGHGHREETEFILPHDATGSKNSVQAIGSSTSYGKRYGACAILNIITRGEDDDAFASGAPVAAGEVISAEQLEQLIELAGAAECPRDRLVAHLNNIKPKGHPELVELAHLPAGRFDEASTAINQFGAALRNARKKQQGEGAR